MHSSLAIRSLIILLVAAATLAANTAPASPADPSPQFEKRVHKDKDKDLSLPYRLLVPRDYDARKSYPLVVWLHGAGEKGSDNTIQVSRIPHSFLTDKKGAKVPAFIFAPQCPQTSAWHGIGINKRPEIADPARMVVDTILELQKEFSIDDKRIYLGGFSMGGIGTWELLVRFPNLFAAAFPIAGATGNRPALANLVKDIPIWVFHGDEDKFVSVEDARKIVAELKAVDGNIKYTEFAKGSHQYGTIVADPALPEWLFAQKRSGPADFTPATIPDGATFIVRTLPDKEHGTWNGKAGATRTNKDPVVSIDSVTYRLKPSKDADLNAMVMIDKIVKGEFKGDVRVTGTVELNDRVWLLVEKIEPGK